MTFRLIQDLMDDLFLFFNIFRKPLVRQRKQDKHGSVFFCRRDQFFKLLWFERNRIDQRPSRINPKRLFHHFHIAGINTKRNIYRQRQLINSLEHHLLFINPIHSHIDIQDPGSLFPLFLRHRHHQLQFSLPKLRLKFLFSGRIDALTYNGKGSLQINFYIISLVGQRPDILFLWEHWNFISKSLPEFSNMFRRGSTTAAEDRGAPLHQRQHILRKFFRFHIINRPAIH